MLFSFLVAGIVIAFTIATLASVVIVRPEPYMEISKNYVFISESLSTSSLPSYSVLSGYDANDDDFYINTFGQANLNFISPNGNLSGVSISATIDLVEHTSSSKLVSGRMPAHDFEILISKSNADNIVETRYGQEQGIWSYMHLYYERMVIGGNDVHVVGVVDTEINLVYMSRNLANLYVSRDSVFMPYMFVDEDLLVTGNMPIDGQIVVTEEMYFGIYGNNDYSGTWPKADGVTLITGDYDISGVYDGIDQVMLLTNFDLENVNYKNSSSAFIYSSRAADLAEELDLLVGITVKDVYQEAYNSAKSQQQIVLLSTLGTSTLLIGFAMVGFYFVIRSSLISRIYEVSVYRALGVKKNEIFVSFIIEIFVLTTISTMVGYILGTLALSKLQGGLLGDFNFFFVTPATVLAGIVIAYVINMIAGLFPVYMLLKKTPAQILSQYDI